ncbi:hypothetical protein OESDEN_23755 [Oesophagostomum dentatum]|uniref:Uncharacterized protein n=1 Tax=Oesophagostomum dentatum TaxID=61180 RepID=A0A0B1S0D0_OESDE|nr:hypothetical protein OESDEN_23755 [Oesophagostomum dentatum]
MLKALSEKISQDFSDAIEAEKRARSLVISGIVKLQEDALDVDCVLSEAFWMGRFDPSRKRLVKVVLPSTYCFSLMHACYAPPTSQEFFFARV